MKKIFITFIFLTFISTTSFAAESLVVKTVNGDEFDLSKLHGKIIVVNFWTSWCPSCISEMGMLEEIYKKYSEKNLEVIAINADNFEDNKNIAVKISKKFSYKIARLSDIKKTSLNPPNSIPTSYILNEDGKIIGEEITDKEELQKKILELMN